MHRICALLPGLACTAAPRFHHQWQPDKLRIETAVPARIREDLTQCGHPLTPTLIIGVAQAVTRRPAGTFTGAAAPRGEGTAAGF